VYPELSSTRLLTLEYIDGKKVSSLTGENRSEERRRRLARRIAEVYLKQIYFHGFFHGDPHPGNIFIMDDDAVCFLDFGIVGTLSRDQQEKMFLMMFGIMRRDAEKVSRALLDLARQSGSVDREQFALRMGQLMSRYLDLPLEHLDIQKILLDLVNLIVQFRLVLPTNLTLLIKVLLTVESVGMALDPEFRTITLIESFTKRMMFQRFRPMETLEDLYFSAMEYGSLLRDLPHEARDLLGTIKNGRLRLELRHRGLQSLIDSFNKASTRVVFSLILSALLISSSVIVHAGVPPTWRNIPIIGLTGYVLAGVIGFGLVVSLVLRAFRE